MDSIDVYELIDEAKRILDKRQSNPKMQYWFVGKGDDQSISYCIDCVKQLRPGAVQGRDFAGAYPVCEEDGHVWCEECGCLLEYVLTNLGLVGEMECFADSDLPMTTWDWNKPDDCYEVARMAYALSTDEQRLKFLEVLKRGENCPAEIDFQ